MRFESVWKRKLRTVVIPLQISYTDSMSHNHPLRIDARPADSPWIETVWRSQSHQAGPFLSIASSRWEMILSQLEGKTYFSVRGPETQPTVAHCPPDGEWMGIQFKHGVFMPALEMS